MTSLDSTPKGVFKGGCQLLTHYASLGFPFHLSSSHFPFHLCSSHFPSMFLTCAQTQVNDRSKGVVILFILHQLLNNSSRKEADQRTIFSPKHRKPDKCSSALTYPQAENTLTAWPCRSWWSGRLAPGSEQCPPETSWFSERSAPPVAPPSLPPLSLLGPPPAMSPG